MMPIGGVALSRLYGRRGLGSRSGRRHGGRRRRLRGDCSGLNGAGSVAPPRLGSDPCRDNAAASPRLGTVAEDTASLGAALCAGIAAALATPAIVIGRSRSTVVVALVEALAAGVALETHSTARGSAIVRNEATLRPAGAIIVVVAPVEILTAALPVSAAIAPVAITVPTPVEAVIAVIVHSQRRAIAAFARPVGTRTAPFIARPVAMDPVLPLAAPHPVVGGTAIPFTAIKHGAVIDRQIPECIGTAKPVAITAGVVGKSNAAAGAETQADAEALRAGRRRGRPSWRPGRMPPPLPSR